MSRIFISGSSTGLGRMAAELLSSQGHQIVLHARNANRAADARRASPKAAAVVTGDVETIAGAKDVAAHRCQSRRHPLDEAKLEWLERLCREQAARRDTCLRHCAVLAGCFFESLEPGWVPTKMGGRGAPDDMDQAHRTQAWLAAGDDSKAEVTGRYFYHLKCRKPNPQAYDVALQDRLVAICMESSGVVLPA
jgi:NAD(P)-dependent dehydrogenase (short-subunit alcohol dehydrogenase family)